MTDRQATRQTTALGVQPVGRLLWHACSQTTLSVGVYGIYALTNAWFVARGVGPDALAGVNLVAPVLLILGAVGTTVGVGGASLVSWRLGAGDPMGAGRAAGNTFVVFWATAFVVMVAGLAALEPLLTVLGAHGEVRGYARDYAEVLLLGAFAATGFSALVRAEGRMAFSTLLWVVGILTQMALDPLLVLGLDMGVRGAALATICGQSLSTGMSMCFFFVQRRRPYRVGLRQLRPHLATIAAVVTIGAPSFLAGFGATMLVVLANNQLAAMGGAVALAAFAVASRLQTFAGMPHMGIAQGLQPVAGYNAGAQLWPRVRRARVLAMRATVGYGALAAAVLVLLAEPLVGLFVDDGPVATASVTAVRIIAAGLVFSGVTPMVSAYFQALGLARPSYALSVGTLVVIKIPLLLLFGAFGGVGVWIGLAAGEVAAALAALILLRTHRDRAAAAG
ncbi:MATE family efflux transporter [Promicromonospora panici]|uniref:MATE family efflux transporter n=1 Tax=Promicromonospora panici TaxID=2219658 RepID=UPI00101D295F|nr:MATE family efflux transporter [Promicromonospora panici]